MIAAAIDVHTRRARHRSDQPRLLHQVRVGHADAARALLDVLVFAYRGHDRAPFGFQFVERVAQFGFQFRRDVPAHAADDARARKFCGCR